jgi:hypothetical protein
MLETISSLVLPLWYSRRTRMLSFFYWNPCSCRTLKNKYGARAILDRVVQNIRRHPCCKSALPRAYTNFYVGMLLFLPVRNRCPSSTPPTSRTPPYPHFNASSSSRCNLSTERQNNDIAFPPPVLNAHSHWYAKALPFVFFSFRSRSFSFTTSTPACSLAGPFRISRPNRRAGSAGGCRRSGRPCSRTWPRCRQCPGLRRSGGAS